MQCFSRCFPRGLSVDLCRFERQIEEIHGEMGENGGERFKTMALPSRLADKMNYMYMLHMMYTM